MSETLRSIQAEQAEHERTKFIIEALDRGVSAADIAATLAGQSAPRPGQKRLVCPECGTTGYAGSYPFSTGYSSLCDDCGA